MKYLKYFESLEKDWSELSDKEKRELQYNLKSEPEPKTNPINNELIDSIVQTFSGDWKRNFESEEEIKEYLDTVLNYDLKILPQQFKLYRIIVLESLDDFITDDFGRHFVEDKNLLSDEEFLDSINIGSEYYDNLWCIEVLVKKEDINIKQTLVHRLLNPEEYEIYMKNDFKPLDYKIEKIKVR